MSDLQARIRDLVPALDYGLESLLGLVDVVETTDIPSAGVPLGGHPRLLINPDFVARHCQTDEALWTLVLHELHHILLGHTRLYRRISPAHNLAFDAVINAILSRRNPTPRWTALFRELYRPDVFPELLLRPPEGFPEAPRYADAVLPAWRDALHHLYYEQTGTFGEVYALVADQLGPSRGAGAAGDREGEADSALRALEERLLGSHGDDARGVGAEDDPALLAAVRRLVERWPQPPDPRIGRSMDEVGRAFVVVVPPARRPDAVLRRAILQAARPDGVRRGLPAPRAVEVEQPWPGRDRRAFALAAAGAPALLHRAELHDPRARRGLSPVDIYVDVSGSMNAWIPHVFRAINSCRDWVRPTVFAFSTQVHEASLRDLAAGRYRSTGGTDGRSVTAHLRARRSRAAVLLTDGYVGPIPAADLAACRAARLQVVLTPGGWLSDLAPAATAVHHLELP